MTTHTQCKHNRSGREPLNICPRHGAVIIGIQCLDCSVFRMFTRFEHTSECERCRRGLLVSQYLDRQLRATNGHPEQLVVALGMLTATWSASPLEESVYQALTKLLTMIGFPRPSDTLPDEHVLKEILDGVP